MRDIGQHKKSGRQMPTSKRRIEGREMKILTPVEKAFLDVFLHEATTAPFRGPATEALHASGVEYGDISYLAWAYEQDVPRTGLELGHSAEVAPPLPWKTRALAVQRNQEVQRLWQQRRKPVAP